MLNSAPGNEFNGRDGTVVAYAKGQAVKPGRVPVMLDGESASKSFKLMNLRATFVDSVAASVSSSGGGGGGVGGLSAEAAVAAAAVVGMRAHPGDSVDPGDGAGAGAGAGATMDIDGGIGLKHPCPLCMDNEDDAVVGAGCENGFCTTCGQSYCGPCK